MNSAHPAFYDDDEDTEEDTAVTQLVEELLRATRECKRASVDAADKAEELEHSVREGSNPPEQ